MSLYPNVTEQDLINLRKLAEQQKNQRTLKIQNENLQQTHDKNLTGSFSPIAQKLSEVNESTEKKVLKKSDSPNHTPQLANENTRPEQPKRNNEGLIYNTAFEKTFQ